MPIPNDGLFIYSSSNIFLVLVKYFGRKISKVCKKEMDIIKKVKILIGILAIIIIGVGGWFVFQSKGQEKRVEIKGKLEIVKEVSPLFNKECLNNDFKVAGYYLDGICKKPYLVASLAEMIGEEIKVKGVVKKVGTIKVIEIEEITPPEIIMVVTEKNQYQSGEKITIHFKHYLKESVFSYFGTEKPVCSIESIEKKENGKWKKLSNWFLPSDCIQIEPKETKPYHLSGEYRKFEWQANLSSGEYRLKIKYKLTKENKWKTIYSNEFIILKPEVISKCKVSRGYDKKAQKEFYKVVTLVVKWDNYNNFSVKEIIIRYGSSFPPFAEGPFLNMRLISQDRKVLKSFRIKDPRVICKTGVRCPHYSRFLKEGEQTIITPIGLYFLLHPKEANKIKFIEFYEYEWTFPEGKTFPGYKPGQLLLRIDLSECMKKFCEEVALENDPSCTGEYYSPPTVIKGRITDPKGNPVENVRIDFSEKTTARGCTGSVYTNKNGEYIINECSQPSETKLIEGKYHLSIYPPFKLNLKSEFREISLKKGETKILNITLKQCGSIAGKITDKEGNPITEAWVYEIGFETPRFHVVKCEPFILEIVDKGYKTLKQKLHECKKDREECEENVIKKYSEEIKEDCKKSFSPESPSYYQCIHQGLRFKVDEICGRKGEKCFEFYERLYDVERQAKENCFFIPYLDPGNYKIGAEVKIGEKYIELSPKEVKVEAGKTTIINFVLED